MDIGLNMSVGGVTSGPGNSYALTTNLITNPNFTGFVAPSTVPDWSLRAATVLIEDSEGLSDTVRVIDEGSWSDLYQDVTLEAGYVYSLGCWMLPLDDLSVNFWNGSILIKAGSGLPSATYDQIASLRSTQADVWQYKYTEFTAPSSGAFNISLHSNTTLSANFYAPTLRKLSLNLITNPTFTGFVAPNTVPDWALYNATIDTGDLGMFSDAVHLLDDGAWTLIWQDVTVESGEEYKFGAWVHPVSTIDAGINGMLMVDDGTGPPSPVYDEIAVANTTVADEWLYYTGTFTAISNSVVFHMVTTAANTAWIYAPNLRKIS